MNGETLALCSAPLETTLRSPHYNPVHSAPSCCSSSQHNNNRNMMAVQAATDKRMMAPSSNTANGGAQLDLYQEEGADVGPRCLMDSIRVDPLSSCDVKLDFIEAVKTFNIGLTHHQRQELEEACIFYECVLHYVYGLLQSFCTEELPSTTLLTLGMHAHNNLGSIAYASGEDDDAPKQARNAVRACCGEAESDSRRGGVLGDQEDVGIHCVWVGVWVGYREG